METNMTMQDPITLRSEAAGGLSKKLIGAGVILLGIALASMGSQKEQFSHSWLFSFTYFYTICMGALFWTILHHATNSGWSVLVRRQLENIASLAVFLFILFIPLWPCFLGPVLWKWMNPANIQGDSLYQAKAAYLNLPFFWGRLIFYFGFFILAAGFFRGRSMRQDTDGNPIHTVIMRKVAYPSIALFAGCITFSGFDWLMGLNHHWYSTMWGVYIFAGAAGSSMALLSLVLHSLKARGHLPLVTQEHFHIVGKLMLAFTIFWAYIGFSQFMLIWYANIPEETVFFKLRNTGSWFYLSLFLVVGHFAVPFLLLLTQYAKKTSKLMVGAALWMIGIHAVDHYWIVMPQLHQQGIRMHWMDLVVWGGMACLLAGLLIRRVMSTNLYAVKDARIEESIHLKN